MAVTSGLLLLQKLNDNVLRCFLAILLKTQNEKMVGCPYDVMVAKLDM
jgi:hypothetical protein